MGLGAGFGAIFYGIIMILGLLLVCFGLLTAYIVFIGLISIWVGLNHQFQDGFLIPIIVGVISIMASLWLFFRFSRYISQKIKDKELVHI